MATSDLERIAQLEEQIRAQDRLFTMARTDDQKALDIAQQASDKALVLAQTANDNAAAKANELRGVVDRVLGTLASKDYVDIKIEGLADRIGITEKRINESGGRSQGRDDVWGYIIGAAGIVIAIAAIAAALAK